MTIENIFKPIDVSFKTSEGLNLFTEDKSNHTFKKITWDLEIWHCLK